MLIQKINNNYGANTGFHKRKNIAFKRQWTEHASWGANYVKETGKTNFKLFSFPDAKAVFVEIAQNFKDSSENIKDRVVQVLSTVGASITVKDVLAKDNDSQVIKMNNVGNGVFELNGVKAKPNDMYRYIILDKDNNLNLVKDPYSKKQIDIHGWSSIYDQDAYEWKNTDWLNGNDPRRITRKPKERLRGLEKLIVEEINIPTLSDEGTFSAAKKQVDIIAKRGIATAIELMPVENTFSQQWGYDGVDKFAVNEKLGGADGLKDFVDYAHGKGLNVIIDMVPNHIGPDGDSLPSTGPYEKWQGRFGGEFNYEGENNKYVRDWMSNAALSWINEFKVDGLRLDLTKLCGSDYLLKQIVTEVNEHNPDVFLIAEDGRENKESVTRYDETKKDHSEELNFIDTQIDFISKKGWFSTPVNIGFDSEWDFRFMHSLKTAVLASGANLLDDIDDRIRNSEHRLKYVMSHDEIGNEDGTRLIPKIFAKYLDLSIKTYGKSEQEKKQRAEQASQTMIKLLVSPVFEKMTDIELKEFENSIGLNTFISKTDLVNAFNTAIAKHKLALGTVMTLPGPKMYFQGDDIADLSYFKFFREFSDEKQVRSMSDDFKNDIVKQKGYDTLLDIAREDSIIGKIKPNGIFADISKQMENFTVDLKQVSIDSPVLINGEIKSTYKDYTNNVHIHQLCSGNEELLVIKNYGQSFHENNFSYNGFPSDGNWQEIFNSDKEKYGGMGFLNSGRKDINQFNQNLSLAPNSFIILKKVN